MLRSLYLKTVRDRWVSALIGVGSLFLIAWMVLAVYGGLDSEAIDVFESLPPAYLSLIGIPADSGSAGLAMSMLFNFIGPFVIAGIAVSMGAAAIAGEEREGTMNLLATVPRSRSRILRSKTAGVLTIVVGITLISWLSYLAAIAITGSDTGSLNLFAATVQVGAVAILYGAVALAIGAWTGNQALASGVAVAFIVVSFLGAGLLPLIDGWADWAKIFPWYYISGSQPLNNGVDWTQVAGLLGIAIILFVLAWWGFNRRDLQSGGARAPMLERLRSNPHLAKAFALLSGSGSVRSIASRAFTDLRALMVIAGFGVLFMGFVVGVMFPSISDSVGGLVDSMPESVLAMVGFADFSTATGWYFGEMLTILAPLAVSVVAISAGVALAGEEKNRTIGVLLGTPTSRNKVTRGKVLAVILGSVVVGFATFAGIALGNLAASLDMSYWNIAAAGLLLAGLGMVLGAAAFLGGALTGKTSVALGSGVGLAVLGWGMNSFLPINPDLANWAKISPFYYYSGENPLEEGMNWGHMGVLVAIAAVLTLIGVLAYNRRDLRG
ncbi:ABC transporter permease subunit [Demequina oxidasica]|uniref:ABC transporter permease subunit n=1 Tax=Demequina oxidasica TaxID=676199 RepID=UPI0007846DD8|nr:ABC transporter permease subunit [Demequina oxidasica]